MKLQIVSDLHLEHAPGAQEWTRLPETDADAIVLAGDTWTGARSVEWAADVAESHGKPVLMVAGNHEFYDGDLTDTRRAMARAAKDTRVHFLDNRAVVLGDTRFLGCTLWTDLGGNQFHLKRAAYQNMNDYRLICAQQWWMTKRGRAKARRFLDGMGMLHAGWHVPEDFEPKILPDTLYDEHKRSRRWLERELARPFDGATIVVTHHAPSYRSLIDSGYIVAEHLERDWTYYDSRFPPYEAGYRIAAYASDLEPLLRAHHRTIGLWIHGHTHRSLDYAVCGVRVIANPRGYPRKRLSRRQCLLLGIPAPPEDEAFENAHVPGNGAFQADAVIDTAEGIAPPLLRRCNETLDSQLPALIAEVERMVPYATYQDGTIAELAAQRIGTQVEAFNQIVAQVVEDVASNVEPNMDHTGWVGRIRDGSACPMLDALTRALGDGMTLSLYSGGPFGFDLGDEWPGLSPEEFAETTLEAMKNTQVRFPKNIESLLKQGELKR